MKDRVFPPVAHIGYVVKDLEPEMEMFRSFYGVENFTVYDFKPMRCWIYGEEVKDTHLKIAMGKSPSGMGIELVMPMNDATSHYRYFLRHTGGGIHHFCYLVEDYDEWREYLTSQPNSYVLYEAEIYDEARGYRRCIFVRIKGATTVIECAEIPRKIRPEEINNYNR